jgi:hypothetical protein
MEQVMTRCALHIGTHKTGTTYIQSFLAKNRGALLRQGVNLPVFSGRKRWFLERKMSAKDHASLPAYFRSDSPEIATISAKIREARSDYTVVSSENFYHLSCTPAVERISRVFPRETVVICYFRDPVQHIVSHYKQLLGPKAKSLSLREFVRKQEEAMSSSPGFAYYRYERNVEEWRHRFANMRARLYARLSPPDLVRQFFADCEIPVTLSRMALPSDRHESPSDEVSLLLVRLNRLLDAGMIDGPARDHMADALLSRTAAIRDLCGDRIRWDDIPIKSFTSTFAHENAKFIADMGMSLDARPAIRFPSELEMSDAEVLAAARKLCEP